MPNKTRVINMNNFFLGNTETMRNNWELISEISRENFGLVKVSIWRAPHNNDIISPKQIKTDIFNTLQHLKAYNTDWSFTSLKYLEKQVKSFEATCSTTDILHAAKVFCFFVFGFLATTFHTFHIRPKLLCQERSSSTRNPCSAPRQMQ